MKVGILTYHHVNNYGALLQAYALAQVVKQQGHEVEFIDYRPYKAIIFYLKAAYLSRRAKLWFINPNFIAYAAKSRNMQAFFTSKFRLTSKTYYTRSQLNAFRSGYDLLICGSDQVWDVQAIRKYDSSYFLDFVDSGLTRKVSYAASCGQTSTFGIYRQPICNLLDQFDAISVRDINSLQLIDRECQRRAIKVLDPTFLADFSEITALPDAEKYALVYADLNPAQARFVKRLARGKGLTIISVGSPCKVADKNFLSIGPEEWLGYFAHATYVFTNFYHGAVFSIIFKKPFTFFSKAVKANKINDLLDDLNLKDRIITSEALIDAEQNPLSEIDYSVVYETLNKSIAKSRQYLAEVLDSTRSDTR